MFKHGSSIDIFLQVIINCMTGDAVAPQMLPFRYTGKIDTSMTASRGYQRIDEALLVPWISQKERDIKVQAKKYSYMFEFTGSLFSTH